MKKVESKVASRPPVKQPEKKVPYVPKKKAL